LRTARNHAFSGAETPPAPGGNHSLPAFVPRRMKEFIESLRGILVRFEMRRLFFLKEVLDDRKLFV
jgi:hypothetical protein